MAMNSSSTVGKNHVDSKSEDENIKEEIGVTVKLEPLECLVCVVRSSDSYELQCTRTLALGTPLHDFLARFTQVELSSAGPCPKYVCKTCVDLINVLEQAEIEYLKIKETFETLLSKNPLFELTIPHPIKLSSVKNELFKAGRAEGDSEDEPLARTKKKHNKGFMQSSRNTSVSNKFKCCSWECDECEAHGEEGGPIALAAHKLTRHTITEVPVVKTEDTNDMDTERYYVSLLVNTWLYLPVSLPLV
ncbi:putative zinc finger protein Kr18 [Operophtera brumata]|uniref:Putative zinc finger protein Kr18 n=1 Tax=Operophtera brumata TaxID=104452 RepID=A0A0L7KVD5_OPEBR|nr:putative zinc finger protein Kr18 [Operophtera brumata]